MAESANVVQFKQAEEDTKVEAVDGLRLHLGCNQHPLDGYVNVDIEPYEGVNVVADLEKRWPWDDDTVAEILTNDLPEHLRQVYEVPDPDLLAVAKDTGSIHDLIAAIEKPKRTYGIFHFMNEAYRVLKVGGILKAQIPTTDHRAWAQDPTHVSYWNENTMFYFLDPAYKAIYPNDIKCNWKRLWVGTCIANPRGESWIKIALEKVANESDGNS